MRLAAKGHLRLLHVSHLLVVTILLLALVSLNYVRMRGSTAASYDRVILIGIHSVSLLFVESLIYLIYSVRQVSYRRVHHPKKGD